MYYDLPFAKRKVIQHNFRTKEELSSVEVLQIEDKKTILILEHFQL